jgi:outer membrane protein OmpA-like peptidoglycan-associated protein
VVDTLIIPDILFETNSSKINKSFSKQLDNILNRISIKTYRQIEVIGHTDNEGSDKYNQHLSINRAIAIRDYIASKNLFNVKDVQAKGLGESQPRSSNKTTAGRQQNRRVEIILKQ